MRAVAGTKRVELLGCFRGGAFDSEEWDETSGWYEEEEEDSFYVLNMFLFIVKFDELT